MPKRKQPTLAAFGFTKKVVHRRQEIKVDIPTYAEEEKKLIKYSHCEVSFVNQQGLSVHTMCKHVR